MVALAATAQQTTRPEAAEPENRAGSLDHFGLPGAGMPGFPLPDEDMRALVGFLRTLEPTHGSEPVRTSLETTDGRTLSGLVLNQTSWDLQLLSDDRLLRLIAAGNSQAFGTLYSRYHAPLYAYCRSIVRDPDDARDALQTTMMKRIAPSFST